MNRRTETHGDHVATGCRRCSVPLESTRAGEFCGIRQCPCGFQPMEYETPSQDSALDGAQGSDGDASTAYRLAPTVDEQDLDLTNPQSNGGYSQQRHQQPSEYAESLPSSAQATKAYSSCGTLVTDIEDRPHDGTGQRMDIDTEVNEDVTHVWVGERIMLGANEGERNGEVAHALELILLVDLDPMTGVQGNPILHVSDGSDMEE
ncbi:hypothetical protein F66182_3853 [Fusarium sp. NRRL 66182]|nr:hypothetical protein F66182_3853 [Fusarium sp. NRRL 66182]